MDTERPYCKIVLVGPLNEHWGDYLGELHKDLAVEDGIIQTTTLTGRPADLLAFIGMLNAIANLGFTLIATEYLRTAPPPTLLPPSPAALDGTSQADSSCG